MNQDDYDNMVQALLAAEGRLKGINEEQLDKFVMVERWRKASIGTGMMIRMLMMAMMRMRVMRLRTWKRMRVVNKVGKF